MISESRKSVKRKNCQIYENKGFFFIYAWRGQTFRQIEEAPDKEKPSEDGFS